MRWRLILLGLLAVAMAVGFVLCTNASTELSYRAQRVYVDLKDHAPTAEQQAAADRMYRQSDGLILMMTPLAAGSLICALAVPGVLGRRWQLREAQSAATRTMSAAGST